MTLEFVWVFVPLSGDGLDVYIEELAPKKRERKKSVRIKEIEISKGGGYEHTVFPRLGGESSRCEVGSRKHTHVFLFCFFAEICVRGVDTQALPLRCLPSGRESCKGSD